MNSISTKNVELLPDEEFRIEVGESQKLRIKVVKGIAEIKGKELLKESTNVFTDVKTSIYTFTGCQLQIEGEADLTFVSKCSPFPAVFTIFDRLYKNLKEENKVCNVLLLGSGKSTVAVSLCNFFVRMHEKVIFTEIDPSKGNIFPGALSTMVIENLSEPFFDLNNPFSLFYGSKEVSNQELYEMQVQSLAEKCSTFSHPNIIVAPEMEHSFLETVIDIFNITHLVVVGDERMYYLILNKMEKEELKNSWGDKLRVKGKKIEAFYVENPGFLQENKVAKSIKRYFYGKSEFTPSRILVNKNNISVLKLGEDFAAPVSALPLGSSRRLGLMGVEEVDLQESSILGISTATDQESVITAPIAGFAVCVDEKKGKILCSQPKLPSKTVYLIQGNIKFIDY
ncbi:hypothetical protein NUSPORA_01428 [Nucleospora cyclopteri]